MILKELDPFHGQPHDVPARVAADRMAYYLRRFYRRSAEVDVLNGLRLRSGNSIVSVDHLLLHAHGLIVLQRDEAVGRLRIDAEGEWHRCDGDKDTGMGSPITHAYVQSLLLKAFLDRRVHQKGFFDRLELDVLVVLSDACEIEWPVTGRLPEVCDRESVHERVSERLRQCCGSTAFSTGWLSASERRTLGGFLRHSHIAAPAMASD